MKNKKQQTTLIQQNKTVLSNLTDRLRWHSWFVFIVGISIYLNTLSHQFTQDDAIVIYDNMYTTKGISGLKGLFTKDTFFGFFKEEGKAKLVSGGRYRPLTPAMFAIEYQLVGNHPWLGHLLNVLLYGFLCMMIYHLLLLLICYKDDNERNRYLVLAAAVIYAAHPIHTEAVANIKGRDEIMSMLGSVVALYTILKYVDTRQIKYTTTAAISFFIAFLSKENTITFLAVIPLALYFFRNLGWKSAFLHSIVLIIPTVLFLMIRAAILGNDFGGAPMELMNNPYLKLVDGVYVPFTISEKYSTILFTLGKYIGLLCFPHPLTHDYYPRFIDIMEWSDASVLLSFILYAGLLYLAVTGFKTRSIPAFAAAYYLITLSIVSNIVFPIGTNMSERFLFMPSLGFALGLSWLLINYVFDKFSKSMFLTVLCVILTLFAVKTFTRNLVWKDDFTLFTTDVKTSVNSAKVLNAAGGALTTEAYKEKDENKKRAMLTQAITYLNQAVAVHPTYKNAYLIMGNAYYYLKEYEKAIPAYEKALAIDPDFKDAATNLAVSLRDAGRQAGEVENNISKAESFLQRSYQLSPADTETLRLLGVANGIKGNHAEAIKYFEKVVMAEPKNAGGYFNLSSAYRNAGDQPNAEMYMKKALELDPEILNKQTQK